jgi:hypothetical protein
VRVIDGDELDTALHQCGDKGQVSGTSGPAWPNS